MLLAIVFLNVWGVLQLVALGSFARTVRVRTVLAAIATGLFFCAPFASALEYTLAAPFAALTGQPVSTVIAMTGYTIDPPIEEIIRVLPILFLLAVPAVRRQLSVTDCVLIGAAAGAGFALAEDLYRFGTAPQYATPVAGGWVAPYRPWLGSASPGTVFIPDIATSVAAWLPDFGVIGLFQRTRLLPNVLLIWSALAGLAVGLVLRGRGARAWYAAGSLLVYVSADHAARNADITLGRELLVTAPLRAFSGLLPWMPLAALGIAWWMDRRTQQPALSEHLLLAERDAAPRTIGTLRAALMHVPASIVWVDRLVRLRRAFNTERHGAPSEAAELGVRVTELRDYVDYLLARPVSKESWSAWISRAIARARRPWTMGRTVLVLPALLWFVIGGWPLTAGLQRALSDGIGWSLVVALSLAAQAWLLRMLLAAPRTWRRSAQSLSADVPAMFVLRTTATAGVAAFGVYGALRAFGVWPSPAMPGAAHASDATCSLPPEQALPMANAGALPPPQPSSPSQQPPASSPQPAGPSARPTSPSASPPVPPAGPPIPSDPWRDGFKDGSAGNPPNYPRNASPEYMREYDAGYKRSHGSDDPLAAPSVPTVRPPLPGEGSRDIFVHAGDETGGVRKITIYGDKTYLDTREAYERSQIAAATRDGFLNWVAARNERVGDTTPWPHPDKWPPPDWD